MHLDGCSFRRSMQSIFCKNWKAWLPRTSTSPIWQMSKSDARVRVVLCSSMTEEYCTGIYHPAKSTISAPSFRWMSFNGVFFSVFLLVSIFGYTKGNRIFRQGGMGFWTKTTMGTEEGKQ